MKVPLSLRALLVLLVLFTATRPVAAQSSATIVKRLTDLETQVTSLVARTGALETENAAQASRILNLETAQASQAATIAALQAALASETSARQTGDSSTLGSAKTYADTKAAGALADAKTYTDSKSATILSSAKTYTDSSLSPIADKLLHFSRSGNEIFITGANLHIVNGTGFEYQQLNSLGNLILGYNDLRASGNVRTGSHNLILGFQNNYSGAGAVVTGGVNSSAGLFASVLGGTGNTSSGLYAVVVGGYNNTTSGNWSTILGGRDKVASGTLSDLP